MALSSWNRVVSIHSKQAGRAGGAAGCGCSRPAEARAGAGRGHPLPAANGARTDCPHIGNVGNVAAKHGRAKRGRVQGLPPEAARAEPPSGGADRGAYGECPCDRARRGWWRGTPCGGGGGGENRRPSRIPANGRRSCQDGKRHTHGHAWEATPVWGVQCTEHQRITGGKQDKKTAVIPNSGLRFRANVQQPTRARERVYKGTHAYTNVHTSTHVHL